MSKQINLLHMRIRIAKVRRAGDLYSKGGDQTAKRAARAELKNMGFHPLTKKEIAERRRKESNVTQEKK